MALHSQDSAIMVLAQYWRAPGMISREAYYVGSRGGSVVDRQVVRSCPFMAVSMVHLLV
jgi:hypothetical protein